MKEEKIGFSLIIKEIYKLLRTNKFPKKSVSDFSSQPQRPKSDIEEDLKKEERRSISLPQSQILFCQKTGQFQRKNKMLSSACHIINLRPR